jgi:hypothetical protein
LSTLPEPIRAFDEAQARTIVLMRQVVAQLQPGMDIGDIVALAEKGARDHGFSGWFHRPVVSIGAGIGRGPLMSRLSGRSKTEVGTLVSIDIGPADGAAYGDLGQTVVVPGAPEPGILAEGREVLKAACGYCSRWKTMGEVFVFSEAWARNRSLKLANKKSIGHRILPLKGFYSRPSLALFGTHFGPNQLHRLNPRRMDGIFAVNPQIQQGNLTVSFEEMVYIHEETRQVLGRAALSEVGT